jgi:hypothetical protein
MYRLFSYQQTPETEEQAKHWRRAPEATRCRATLDWSTLPLHAECDLPAGHEGAHQYMSKFGAIVSFQGEP